MNVQSTVRQQLGFWRGNLDQMLAGCTPDILNKNLEGATITSIGSVYAHLVFAEDSIVHGMLQGKPPIYQAQGWGEKLSVKMPETRGLDPEWARAVHMELPSFQQYAKAVHAATDSYLDALPDSELQRKVNTSVGEQNAAWVLSLILGTHFPQHIGEIAALKGVQGFQGLPF